MEDNHLFAWPKDRPEKCAIASVAFSGIADQVAAIASSMAYGKCYDKHSKLIGELSQISQGLPKEETENLLDIKNGALIQLDKPMTITISNTQIQSVQNHNALVSGLNILSKDKDCLQLLKGKDQLSAVGKTLSTVGAISMLIPSPLGLAGSITLVTAGGAMSVLDRILTPKFDWSRASERREFMSLTCAFYNLRSQLIAADFFSLPSPEDKARIELARKLLRKIELAKKSSEQSFQQAQTQWQDALVKHLTFELQPAQAKLYQSTKQILHVLESAEAAGKTVEERLTVDNAIRSQGFKLLKYFSSVSIPKLLCKRLRSILEMWQEKSSLEILALSQKTWDFGYIRSLKFYLQLVIQEALPMVDSLLESFYERHDFNKEKTNDKYFYELVQKQQNFRREAMRLKRELQLKIQNLQRLQKEQSLSDFDDGHQSRYEIMRGYEDVKLAMLGHKGLSFVKFLSRGAKKKVKAFNYNYARWKEALLTKDYHESWFKRDAGNIAFQWDFANNSVELAYDFLSTNQDLLSHFGPRYRKFLKIIPVGRSYHRRLLKALKSAEYAKAIMTGNDFYKSKRMKKLKASSSVNLGEIIYRIKSNEYKRRKLAKYIHTPSQ